MPLQSVSHHHYRYLIIPLEMIQTERMGQVELYYRQAFLDIYSAFAIREEKNGCRQEADSLWNEILRFDPGNRRAIRQSR